MTDSWDEVQENPGVPPEAGRAAAPSHDAQERLMQGWGWAAWWKASHDAQEVSPWLSAGLSLQRGGGEGPEGSSLAFASGKIQSSSSVRKKTQKVFYSGMQPFTCFSLFLLY